MFGVPEHLSVGSTPPPSDPSGTAKLSSEDIWDKSIAGGNEGKKWVEAEGVSLAGGQ